ncbi:hypothetical protein BT67DRAFT_381266, partial [Trichocladium antarcticum]
PIQVKCDRGQPACGWCIRNGAHCEYKERKKPGLRAGYGRKLEQRLDKLEERLRMHNEILQSLTSNSSLASGPGSGASGTTHSDALRSLRGSNTSQPSDYSTPREPVLPSSMFARPDPDQIRTPQAETALFLPKPSSTSADYGLSAAPPAHDGFRAVTGISPRSHMQTVMGPSTAAQEHGETGPAAAPSLHSPAASASQNSAQMTAEQDLPPYDLLYALVDLYFKHINTWCPILHRKTTLDSLFGPSMIDDEDKILLHAVVATALRFSTDARLTEVSRRRYCDASKQRVLLYGMEKLSVKSVQALLILALDLCGSSNGPPGWNIMALITRAVVRLGLASETTSFAVAPSNTSTYTPRAMILPEPRDFLEEESRRRLFWMVYLLDRYATIATAFEFGVDDCDIDRTLPCRDDLWLRNQKVETRWFRAAGDKHADPTGVGSEHKVDKPENLGAFSYYIEILGILSSIHKFLKQPVDIRALSDVETWQTRYKELDSMLAAWRSGLPGECSSMAKLFHPAAAKTLNCSWVMLHATHHTAVIRLHASAAYPTTRSAVFAPSHSAAQRCHAAVENMAALCDFVAANGLLAKLGPPFAFSLWVAARVLLVHGSTVARRPPPPQQIAPFADALRDMGRCWPAAARYSALLGRVLDERRDGETALAEMRRTAFDLDGLVGRQRMRHVPAGLGRGVAEDGAGVTDEQVRTPAAKEWEWEYLDVFDFFNVPRLPVGRVQMGGNGDLDGHAGGGGGGGGGGGEVVTAEVNITDFTVDASRDWLVPRGDTKFMS